MMKKRKGQRRGAGLLKQFQVAVQRFVATAAAGDQSRDAGLGVRRVKSRKEMRKERRMQKKCRMRDYYQRKHLNRSPEVGEGVDSGVKPLPVEGNGHTGPGSLEEERKEEKAATARPPPAQAARGKGKSKQTRRMGLLEANEEEEREIQRLEKALGLNKRKNKSAMPQAFARDGLDYILGVIEPGAAGLSGLYESDDETSAVEEEDLMNEEVESDPDQTENQEGSGEDTDSGQESEGDKACVMEMETSQDDDEEEGGSQPDQPTRGNARADCSNNHVHKEQTSSEETVSQKYIPPQLREMSETMDAKKKEELARLKKNVKGLLNRLSEPNMASISNQLEEFYMTNSRKDMNDTLTDVLLAACVTPALMPDRLMMEHVLLISILHHNVGIEVGGHVLETIVKQFDEHSRSISETKECDNLINLIAHFYNFHVIQCVLVFDILKKLTSNFKEKDIALILLLLKQVGFTLRKDDAAALRDLIIEAQNKANSVGKQFQDQTRIRFMLETMLALKNNDMRKIPGYDPEPVEKLRKLQRSLIHNNRGDFLLRATLENLLTADQVGRWWIVGSSWSGVPMIEDTSTKKQQNIVGEVSGKIMELARKQRMNTDIRKNIFCVMMTSEDYLDAFEKLLRLGLKDQQEREIIHVLLHCCLQEKIFNPFYAFLVEKFCEYDRRFQMTFQFSMWDRFRELKSMTNVATTSLVRLLVHLLSKKVVSLSIFKVIEFSELDKPKVRFLRQILQKLLMETEQEELVAIFQRISGIPKLAMLREGLKLFIIHFLLKNASSLGTSEQTNLLKERVEIAEKALQTKDTVLKF
ncbi:nucleolar MIF4G domain-containing protein 1 isoform X2 [Scyliorhinus canicula]|uniref:nucleolar MIF4G domain-containing protein 1 isoform X2 n=1 Tax=Scyliorhinus canicula TaxID=7830 RepID=UPI0018F2C3A6|nr:nucleolar MIF4G domain-containing protein 1 isoform X2 [Scyliorhinus canicula]